MGLAEFRPERKLSGKRSKKSFNACVCLEYNEIEEVTTGKKKKKNLQKRSRKFAMV
jgi:hypothetical protein